MVFSGETDRANFVGEGRVTVDLDNNELWIVSEAGVQQFHARINSVDRDGLDDGLDEWLWFEGWDRSGPWSDDGAELTASVRRKHS